MPRLGKQQRQQRIRRIVSERRVSSQEELRSELLKQSVAVTQATLSRDVAELGLIKHPATGTYQLPEGAADPPRRGALLEQMRQLVREVDWSGNLVLVKTAPGDAQAAGERFDTLDFPQVAGTLAGDDTLLVVLRPRQSARRFARRLEEMLQGPRERPPR